MPPLPNELLGTLLKGQWKVSPNEEDHRRRSIYLFVRRNLRYPLFEVFDRPDTNATCPRRNISTIAPQALELLNSQFSLACSQELAGYVLAQADQPEQQIRLCFQRTLSREPTAEELKLAQAFLTSQASTIAAQNRQSDKLALPQPLPAGANPAASAALVDFCLALFNLNEFVYLD